EAAWLAGDGPRALGLLDDVAELPAPPGARAEAAHLRGRVLARCGPVPLAIEVLASAAETIAADDPARAAEMLAEAAYAALSASCRSPSSTSRPACWPRRPSGRRPPRPTPRRSAWPRRRACRWTPSRRSPGWRGSRRAGTARRPPATWRRRFSNGRAARG